MLPKNKSKKKLRETNSYQIQYKNKKDNKTQKSNYNTIYSISHYSTKTFNKKPLSNLTRDPGDFNSQSLSNFANSDMNLLIQNEKIYNKMRNKKDEELKAKEDIKSQKMNIKELSNSYNSNFKINSNISREEQKNNLENQEESKNNDIMNKNDFENIYNKYEKSTPEFNKKKIIKLKNINQGLNKQKSSKIFKKMNRPKVERNLKRKNNLELYLNKKPNLNLKDDEEKNNDINSQNNIEDDNNNNEFIESNLFRTNIDINSKFDKLYTQLFKKTEKASISQDNINLTQITYPNLKRYRQKSEPSIKIDIDTLNIKEKNNIYDNNKIIKYPSNNNINNNLSKFKKLEDKIKNENSTKRMINSLLNQQSNPELKEILTGLQITINKFSNNEGRKDNNRLSTLPANYLCPFNTFVFDNNSKLKKNFNFIDRNYNTQQKYYNKKKEKFKSTFNDFKKIINEKKTSKNNFKKIKNNNYFQKKYFQTKIVYSNLCPVNSFKDDLFILES